EDRMENIRRTAEISKLFVDCGIVTLCCLVSPKRNMRERAKEIIGDENFGISESILKQCDTTIHINMFGQNSSMNVVQATNIALYEITKQLI
ncbi:MAG: adenylyl-sulfate kinase, partial [Lacinutrix sp.]|uniref:adenylyl-sulfate kinase n=1 Tax=Lacinutrix sp. TaxID=1937692 RepID=UPI00309F53EE